MVALKKIQKLVSKYAAQDSCRTSLASATQSDLFRLRERDPCELFLDGAVRKIVSPIGPFLPHHTKIITNNSRIDQSKREIIGRQRSNKIDSDSHGPTHRLQLPLAPKFFPYLFGLIKPVVDLHQIHRDHFPFVGQSSDYVHRLPRTQPVPEPRASLRGRFGVYRIDIKRQMKGVLVLGVEVLHAPPHDLPYAQLVDVVHRETSHIMLPQSDVFIVVDIANRDKDHVSRMQKGSPGQPPPLSKIRKGAHPRGMRERHSVVIVRAGNVGPPQSVVYCIRMRVHPNHLQLRVRPQRRRYRGRTDRMVAPDRQQKIGFFIHMGLVSPLVEPAQKRAQNLHVPYRKINGRKGGLLLRRGDVAVVPDRDVVVLTQKVEHSCFAD